MDEESFYSYLKKNGRSDAAAARCVHYVLLFDGFLKQEYDGKKLDEVTADDLESFVAWADSQPKPTTKTYLWALVYYFDFKRQEDLKDFAAYLRAERITRRPFPLRDFMGVADEHVQILRKAGIHNVDQMLERAAARGDRSQLAHQTGLSERVVLEFVQLSDLARIQGIKGIRARLYVDAGIDSIEKLAASDPEELRQELLEFVEVTNFDGIAPLPAELRSAVRKATALPKIVEY